ncbi:MAG: alanine racemase, partial [bacterium]|nr:alanine racemase [bacterium]
MLIKMIADNIKAVRQRIARSCEKAGRPADSVTLVCVTKGAGLDRIEEALGLGVKVIGENRVQEALQKYALIGSRAEWHMVGHLQTNKAKDAVKIFSLIHSVDSIGLVKEIDKEAAKIGKVQDIL